MHRYVLPPDHTTGCSADSMRRCSLACLVHFVHRHLHTGRHHCKASCDSDCEAQDRTGTSTPKTKKNGALSSQMATHRHSQSQSDRGHVAVADNSKRTESLTPRPQGNPTPPQGDPTGGENDIAVSRPP